MRFLLRLYPRAWRDGYEDEFLAAVEGRDLSLSDAVDIILGAFDARLSEWGRSSQHEIPSPGSRRASHVRLAASLLMIAGIALLAPPVVAHVVFLPAYAQAPNLMGLVALALSGAATLALWSPRPHERPTRTGDVGTATVLASVCMIFVTVTLTVLFASPVPAWLAVSLHVAFNAGWALLGIAETRRGWLPPLAPLAVGLAGAQGTVGPCLVLVLTLLHGGGTVIGIGWVLMANPVLAASWILLALALPAAPERIRQTMV